VKTLGLLLFLSTAFADLSPQWVDAPAHAPNIRVLIHREHKDSTFIVQAPDAKDPRIAPLFKNFEESKAEKLVNLLPHVCFELKRADLESRQTWCRTQNGLIRTFIELGETKMRPGERLEVQLKALGEAK
jgi:hypothetical protein